MPATDARAPPWRRIRDVFANPRSCRTMRFRRTDGCLLEHPVPAAATHQNCCRFAVERLTVALGRTITTSQVGVFLGRRPQWGRLTDSPPERLSVVLSLRGGGPPQIAPTAFVHELSLRISHRMQDDWIGKGFSHAAARCAEGATRLMRGGSSDFITTIGYADRQMDVAAYKKVCLP